MLKTTPFLSILISIEGNMEFDFSCGNGVQDIAGKNNTTWNPFVSPKSCTMSIFNSPIQISFNSRLSSHNSFPNIY